MSGFLKFDGVEGESKDKNHEKWSRIESFGQGMTQPGGGATGATRRRGSVIMDDIAVSKEMDKASPKIAEALCTGKVFPKVEIHLVANYGGEDRQTYYAYELKNVLVTGYNVGGSAQAEDVPMEDFTLNFEEIKVTYTEFDEAGKKKGNVEYSHKVEEGTK